MAEHRLSTRECPGCNTTKPFEARAKACSKKCADKLKRAGIATEVAAVGVTETQEMAGDTWAITLPKTSICTLDELLDHCKVDRVVWDVERFVVNKWEMGSKTKDGGTTTTPLYQVKAWLRKHSVKIAISAEIAALKEDAKAAMPALPMRFPKIQSTPSGIMLEVSIPDLHMGKLAWAKETGYQNYDSVIAAQLFRDAVASILDRSQAHKPEEICLVVGNDLLNADNMQLTTTRGTPQHSDVRYHKTFRTTRQMISDAVISCRQIAPVRVIMVPGNHDQLSTWHLGDSLECFFDRTPGVVIDNQPTSRKYHEWGTVMLCWTHGDKTGHNKLPLLMATEQREMFGRTSWREIHLGHLHQVSLREQNGVRVRILPSLTAADAWHSEMGFVGNIRSAEAYIWHREQGLVGTSVFIAPDYDERRIAAVAKKAA